jgi:hypothetical protein
MISALFQCPWAIVLRGTGHARCASQESRDIAAVKKSKPNAKSRRDAAASNPGAFACYLLVVCAGLDFAGCGLGLGAYLGGHAVVAADETLYVWKVGWRAGQE